MILRTRRDAAHLACLVLVFAGCAGSFGHVLALTLAVLGFVGALATMPEGA